MSLVDPKPPEPEQGQVRKPRIVALLNQKGGVGKTTSTVNLGAALARLGQRVLLVDLDPQSNLSLHFGVEPRDDQPSAHELLVQQDTHIQQVLMQARPGLDFVPSVTELALVEGELAQREGMQHVLRKKLEPVYANYDIVLLDCPPSLGVLSVNALTAADEVFVPMQAHYLPLRGLEKLLQTVHLVSQSLNEGLKVTGILLCMHEGQSSHARAVISEIESQLSQYRNTGLPWENARVLSPAVRRNIKLAEAPSFGMTIFDYAPRCPGAQDYRMLAESLLAAWGLVAPEFDTFRPRSKSGAARRPRKERKARAARKTRKSRTTKTAKTTKSRTRNAPKTRKSVKKSASRKTSKASTTGGSSRRARNARATRASNRSSAPARIRSGGLSL